MPTETTKEIRSVAQELELPLNDAIVDACHRRLDALREPISDCPSDEGNQEESVESSDPYNAFLATFDDTEQESRQGPLSDLSIGVKDNIAVADLPLTCGLEEVGYRPTEDATVLTRLTSAGVTVVGKTNMDGLAIGPGGQMSEFGAVVNPVCPDRIPGGSSAGSAAAVAAGLVDAALGTDTGGSVRKPAAYCNLVGFKPTHGVVPSRGLVDLAPSLDTIGPIAPTVETTARVFAGMTDDFEAFEDWTGHNEVDSPIRIGIPTSFLKHATPPVKAAFDRWRADVDGRSEFETRDVELANDVSRTAYPVIIAAEFASIVRQGGVPRGLATCPDEPTRTIYRRLRSRGFNEHIAERMLPGAVLDSVTGGDAYFEARQSVERFVHDLTEIFQEVDAIATPTTPTHPPTVEDISANKQVGQSDNTRPFNLAQVPTIALPIEDELPVSVQITTPQEADWRALEIAGLLRGETGRKSVGV